MNTRRKKVCGALVALLLACVATIAYAAWNIPDRDVYPGGHTPGVGDIGDADCSTDCYQNPWLPECSADCFNTIMDHAASHSPRKGIYWY